MDQIKSSQFRSSYSPYIMNFSGLTDQQGAKTVAERLKQMYDRNKDGKIDRIEVVPMIVDAYRSFNRHFNPSSADIDSYLNILDVDRDGYISQQDLESMCIKYLCPPSYQFSSMSSSGFQSQQLYTQQQQQKPTSPVEKQEKPKQAGIQKKLSQLQTDQLVIKQLQLIERIFDQMDQDKNGYIDRSEAKQVLIETYKSLGQTNFQPTEQDIDSWMRMCDQDGDGKVTLPEFEVAVAKSLEKQGFKVIYNEQGKEQIISLS